MTTLKVSFPDVAAATAAMRNAREQLYLSDDMQPPPDPARDPDVDAVLHPWLAEADEARRLTDAAKAKRDRLLAMLLERGLERYPYVDAAGKKRYFVADRTARAKQVKAIEPRKPKAKRERARPDPAEQVEHRKVSRASVADEIGEHDGFASVRERMGATP